MAHDEQSQKRHEEDESNPKSRMEKAEGSRDNVNVDDEMAGNQGGRGTSTLHRDRESSRDDSELPPESFGQGERGHDQGGGISNRPVDEEQGRQENLPPRGERRENWKED
jgi:hypothetical protein